MIKRLWPYAKKYQRYFLLACACIIGETVFELVIPVLMANIIDVGVANKDTNYIVIQGILMVVLCLYCLCFRSLICSFCSYGRTRIWSRIEKDEFEKVQNFSFANTDHFSTSSLITRLTSDVIIIQNAICNGIRPLVRAPFMLLLALFFTFTINAKLALIFLVSTPILGIGLFVIVRKVGPLFKFMQSSMDNINTVVQENLNAIRVVKSYVV